MVSRCQWLCISFSCPAWSHRISICVPHCFAVCFAKMGDYVDAMLCLVPLCIVRLVVCEALHFGALRLELKRRGPEARAWQRRTRTGLPLSHCSHRIRQIVSAVRRFQKPTLFASWSFSRNDPRDRYSTPQLASLDIRQILESSAPRLRQCDMRNMRQAMDGVALSPLICPKNDNSHGA
jgi:hypothetical protein